MGLELGPQELRASKMSAFPRVPKKARLAAFQRATEREILGEFQTMPQVSMSGSGLEKNTVAWTSKQVPCWLLSGV